MMFILDTAQQLLQRRAEKKMISTVSDLVQKKIHQEAIKEAQVQVEKQTFFSTIKKHFQTTTVTKSLILEPQKKKLVVFRDKNWENPKPILLTRTIFDKYEMEPIKKLKCRRKLEPLSSSLKQNFYIMKVVVNKQDIFYASDPQIIYEYFKKIILVKLFLSQYGPQKSQRLQKRAKGYLLKKISILGIWESVYATIDEKEGLICSEQQNEPYDLQIKYIKEIWTWFELIEDNYLVIKMKRRRIKRQFAIPVQQLTKWIPAFMSLLNNPQNRIGIKKKIN